MAGIEPLPILQEYESLLREVSKPVPDELFGTDELNRIIDQMTVTLDGQHDGVALAAPQVGILYRIFIVRYDRARTPEERTARGETAETPAEPEVGVFINPHFINSSRRRVPMDEGCLSVRGLYGTTFRHERASVRAQDANGAFFERGGGGIMAQIYQHETDHLNGILFIDHAENLVEVRKKEDGEGFEEVPITEETLAARVQH